MSKHTPGPWQLGEYDEHLGYDCITGGVRVGPVVLDARDYGQTASWSGEPWDRARFEADANLIAAAPTGYALALEIIRGDGTSDSQQRAIDLARELLAVVEKTP